MRVAAALLLLLSGCSSPEPNTPRVSKEPISVRGWIAGGNAQYFQGTNVWVDNAPYVSGGVAENGAFLLLDVPPGNLTIEFCAPGAPGAKLVLQNVPGNADVFIPGLVLQPNTVALLDPKLLRVRMAARVDTPTPTTATATVAGVTLPVVNVPYNDMTDRHDYPVPPGTFKPMIVVH
jgi:hypothetical protein